MPNGRGNSPSSTSIRAHRYHPGGIDFDGICRWVPVAEYRPDSSSIIYRVSPRTFASREALRVDDHIGGIVRDRVAGRVHGVGCGLRTLYQWSEGCRQLSADPTPATESFSS